MLKEEVQVKNLAQYQAYNQNITMVKGHYNTIVVQRFYQIGL